MISLRLCCEGSLEACDKLLHSLSTAVSQSKLDISSACLFRRQVLYKMIMWAYRVCKCKRVCVCVCVCVRACVRVIFTPLTIFYFQTTQPSYDQKRVCGQAGTRSLW